MLVHLQSTALLILGFFKYSLDSKSLTRSSILRMLRTVSVAKVSALMETSRGWTTSSSRMLEIPPWETRRRVRCLLLEIFVSMQHYWLKVTLRTLIPAVFSPCACLLRSSVTVEMGLRPAFSARVEGMISRASAYARTQYASMPPRLREYSANLSASSISGAPPPAIRALQTHRKRRS